MIAIVHCQQEPYDVYIGRGSKWGNPFKIGVHGTRKQVIEQYRRWIVTQPELMAALSELRGKTLGCWCKHKNHPKPCHGDVLAELASPKPQLLFARTSVNKANQPTTNAMANPYKILHSKLKALLLAEHKLSDEEKKNNEWILVSKFHGVKVTVGKGDVATIFYQFGDGKRAVCYPDEMSDKLEKLAKRKHWIYHVLDDKRNGKVFFTEKAALKIEPKAGWVIQGLGEKIENLYTVKRSVRGLSWEPAKGKK